MKKQITIILLSLITLSVAFAQEEKSKFDEKEWMKNEVSINVKIPHRVTVDSNSIYLYIEVTNNSKLPISFLFPDNPLKMLLFNICTMPDGKEVDMTKYGEQRFKEITSSGPLFMKVISGSTYSFKIDLAKYFILDKMSQYEVSLETEFFQGDKKVNVNISKLKFRRIGVQ